MNNKRTASLRISHYLELFKVLPFPNGRLHYKIEANFVVQIERAEVQIDIQFENPYTDARCSIAENAKGVCEALPRQMDLPDLSSQNSALRGHSKLIININIA